MSENVDPNIPVGDGENGGEPVGNGVDNGIVDNIGGGESNQGGGTAEGGGDFGDGENADACDKTEDCKCKFCREGLGNGTIQG